MSPVSSWTCIPVSNRVEQMTRVTAYWSVGERCVTAHNCTAWECPLTGVIGFDIGLSARRSGSRTHGQLVHVPCKPIGANSKRTDFALAA